MRWKHSPILWLFLFEAPFLPAILPEITATGMTVYLQNGFGSRVAMYSPVEPNKAQGELLHRANPAAMQVILADMPLQRTL